MAFFWKHLKIIAFIFSNWINQYHWHWYYFSTKTLKPFFCFQISIHFWKTFRSFIIKCIHSVSSKSFYMHSLLEIISIKVNFLIILVANEISKILVTKTRLIRYYYLINLLIFIWMNRGNKSASWNDKLDLEVLWYLYNWADTLKSDSN